MLTQAEDAQIRQVDRWQRPDGQRYRPIVLRATTQQGPQRVGLAALLSRGADPLPGSVWELAAALGTRLLELGDAVPVALD